MKVKPHMFNGTPALFRIRHPVGAQGRQRCRVGNFPEARPALGGVDLGRDGSAWYVGARKSAEVGVFPERELYVRGIQLFPGRILIVEY